MPNANAHYDQTQDTITTPAQYKLEAAALAAMHDDTRLPAWRDIPHKGTGSKPADPSVWESLAKYLPDVEVIYDQVSDYVTREMREARVVELIGKGDHSLNEKELRELQRILQDAKNDHSLDRLVKEINETLKANGSTAELSVGSMPCGKRLERDRVGDTYLVQSYQVVLAMAGGRNQTFTVESKS